MSDKAKAKRGMAGKGQVSKVAGKAKAPEGGSKPKVPSSEYIGKGRQCRATSKATGERCRRMAMSGLLVCVVHGGATRRAKTAAAKRIAQASGYAADMLVEFMADPAQDVQLRTKIAQDLLNRAGVSAATVLEVTTRSYEDVIEGFLVEADEAADSNVIDAEVVEDQDDSWLEDRDRERRERRRKNLPPLPDRPTEPRVERAPEPALTELERAERERALLRDRERLLLDKDAGTYQPSSRAEEIAAMRGLSGKRGARVTSAHLDR